MKPDHALVDAMFARHGASGGWQALPSIGLANLVFATCDVVLRVATDHPDGVPDARTECVAAPVAHAAGILTPRMIAFDDTRSLIDRPYSLWERVHGETLGLTQLTPAQLAGVWRDVGRELAKLHLRVRECADPQGWLDPPARDQDIDAALKGFSMRAGSTSKEPIESSAGPRSCVAAWRTCTRSVSSMLTSTR